MSLEPTYLEYPKRKHGMDHGIYPWSNIFDRKPVKWPGEKNVALWVVANLEYFPLTPGDKPFRAPGHMQTPYPDYRHYSAREYGTRVGFYRLLDAFDAAGIKASIAVNSAIATRYPTLLADIVSSGHEIIAHSTDMNGTIASDIAPEAERELIVQSLDTLTRAAGKRPRGWHSIARSQSKETLRLLVELGVTYQCDWANDDLPYWMTTDAGKIGNMPLNHELSDRQIISVQQQSMSSYVEQVEDAYAFLSGEAKRSGGRMLPLNVTPYIVGLPFRIDLFDALLKTLAAKPDCWTATGTEIFEHWASTSL